MASHILIFETASLFPLNLSLIWVFWSCFEIGVWEEVALGIWAGQSGQFKLCTIPIYAMQYNTMQSSLIVTLQFATIGGYLGKYK